MWRFLWRRKWQAAFLTLLGGFVLLVWMARQHAYAMTHFAPEGAPRTGSAETLTPTEKLGVLFNGVVLPKPQNDRNPNSLGLEFQTITYPGFGDHDLESWYIPGPGTGFVLLFHGYGASKSAVLGYAAQFHEWGFSSLMVDFHGSGGSSGHTTSIGYQEAEDVAASLEWVLLKVPESKRQKVILYGLSMGGAAITRACAELGAAPDGIVLESVFPSFRETVAMRFRLMGLPDFPAADLLLFWGGQQLGIPARLHNPKDYARQITCPVLVLTGKRDLRVPEGSVRGMLGNFAGSAELSVYDLGHVSFIGAQPEHWGEDVSKFLQRL